MTMSSAVLATTPFLAVLALTSWRAVLAMIEGPIGIYNAREIAAHVAVTGLIAGVNDICAEMGIKPGPNREGLELALQSIVLATAAASPAVASITAVCWPKAKAPPQTVSAP